MKVKFIKVWDYSKFGYVKFIILQVEETDYFLTEANFNPGYKFIIQAMYNRVGAAGGHNFNVYHGNRVRNISQKIETTEADVLGFYLQNVSNIYDAPEELNTENIWDVVLTDRYSRVDEDEIDDIEYLENNVYKVLTTSIYESSQELTDNLINTLNSLNDSKYNSGLNIDEIKEMIHESNERLERWGVDLKKTSRTIKFLLIDKNNFEVINSKSSSKNESIIADYLWLPCEELPIGMWNKVVEVNEGYSFERFFNHNEENINI